MTATRLAFTCGLLGLGACAQQARAPQPLPTQDGSGALALTVHYGSLCATPTGNDVCETISYPEVCWMGKCESGCSGKGEAKFSICAPGGTRSDDPLAIDQTVDKHELQSGRWSVKAFSPSWRISCGVQVQPGMLVQRGIDSAEQNCI